nr:signal peptidase I [Lacticaseibacillus mingshuiensis]
MTKDKDKQSTKPTKGKQSAQAPTDAAQTATPNQAATAESATSGHHAAAPSESAKKGGGLRDLFKWVGITIVFVAIAVLGVQYLTTEVIGNDTVVGTSMNPTLAPDDKVITLRHKKITRNAIVVLDAPDEPGSYYIKRVVGLPGETVEVKDEKLYIDGKQVAQPYLNDAFMRQAVKAWQTTHDTVGQGVSFTDNFKLKEKVPAGHYFVLGDDRRVSHDSRDFGFVKKSAIRGVVALRYWPLNHMKFF